MGIAVDSSHQLHLLLPFLDIGLINTHGINPDGEASELFSQVLEGRITILSDGDGERSALYHVRATVYSPDVG